jgi:hypothetical protein
MDRLNKLLDSEVFIEQLSRVQENPTLLHSALYKAICHSQIFLKQDSKVARILIIQLGQDNATQFEALVNGIFAAQKLKITIDCLVLDLFKSEKYERDDKQVWTWTEEICQTLVPTAGKMVVR